MFAVNNLQQQSSGWIWYVILVLILLIIVIWWWLSHRRGEPVQTPYQAPVQEKRTTAPDDLTRIEGIGPKVAKVLNTAGITTFADLANAKAQDVQEKLRAAGLQMMNPEGWIEQAALAAKGDWSALEKLQGELKGGRRK
jgi:hypothetical protein